ncbi:glycosyltransferase [Phycicoccus sp.]|uniref:glycosyltransferase n=1 Tax=Phycicoccus sp. TaxID=1902410 RepID=UPI002D10B212|nr:glycosyltransferase [Phycicoccus sp.]HMM93425.1 glycosyltransferase [Phycicoccus sp.]
MSSTPGSVDTRFGEGDGPTLLVASTGGHLEQMRRLRGRLVGSVGAVEWATFDGNQSRSLLRDDTVHYVDYIRPRDLTAAVRDLPDAVRILRAGGYRAVVSTGAGIAVPFFLAAKSLGIPRYYIESAARAAGPSLTGRIVSRIPGTRLFTQYPELATGRWSYCGSLFDGFEAGPALEAPPTPHRVVVTLGTMPRYGFRRAVERLVRILPDVASPDAEVMWQTGATDLTGLGITGSNQIPADELRTAIQEADLVIAHGGIGSALTALDAGKMPVMIPRRVEFDEHVDDHQALICTHLGSRGIALSREVHELEAADLWRAAAGTVRAGAPAPMVLGGPAGRSTRQHRRVLRPALR